MEQDEYEHDEWFDDEYDDCDECSEYHCIYDDCEFEEDE